MAVTYEILRDGSLAVIRYIGTITKEEIVASQRDYLSDPEYRPGTPELAVFDEAREMDFDFQKVWSLLSEVGAGYQAAAGAPRISIFAPSDMPFGLSRIFQALAEYESDLQVMVHRTEADALAWLGRDERRIADLPF